MPIIPSYQAESQSYSSLLELYHLSCQLWLFDNAVF